MTTTTKTSSKTAILILSDPRSSSDEALGRVFNALAATYDFVQAGEEVTVLFQGAGSRWVAELSDASHPAHELFESVKSHVAGVSCGCADVFGAADEVGRSGFELIKDNPVPGTSGLPSLRRLMADGFRLLTF